MTFGKDFLWGAATSAAQIEGAYLSDGKTPSIWDAAPRGRIRNGDTCHDGADHYHHMKEDVALMKTLGLKSYRFSVSWSRVQPAEGTVNEKGLRFYRDLVEELCRNGITPIVTLYHWDMPLWVHEKGGFLSEKIVPLFAEYMRIVTEALSDKVSVFIPMNEPQCFIMNGYMLGVHAPFYHRLFSASTLTKNCLAAHRASVEACRRYARKTPTIGISLLSGCFCPNEDTDSSIELARRKTFHYGLGTFANRWWSDPLLAKKSAHAFGFGTHDRDMDALSCDLDFVGLNVYRPFQEGLFGTRLPRVPEDKKNFLGWEIDARSLYWTTRFFYERYHLPVMITENGLAERDVPDGGAVHDSRRVVFLTEHIEALSRVVSEGIPLLGYQYWSLLDNFEWAEGFAPRFGLIHVDYATKKRTLKDSAFAYSDLIASLT